jgi:hypothetical protein
MAESPRFSLFEVDRFRPDTGVNFTVASNADGKAFLATVDLTAEEWVVIVSWMRALDQQVDEKGNKRVKKNVTVQMLKDHLLKHDIPPTDITKFEGATGFWKKYCRKASNKGFEASVEDDDLQSIIGTMRDFKITPSQENNIADPSKVKTGGDMLTGFLGELVKLHYPAGDFDKLATLITLFPEDRMTEKWIRVSDLPSLNTPKKKTAMTGEERSKRLLSSLKKKLDKVYLFLGVFVLISFFLLGSHVRRGQSAIPGVAQHPERYHRFRGQGKASSGVYGLRG